MAQKRTPNILPIGIAVVLVASIALVLCSDRREHYEPFSTLPEYEKGSKPADGDTQADTIKALQAYAKEAVRKADELNQETISHTKTVYENKEDVSKLKKDVEETKELLKGIVISNKQIVNQISLLKGDIEEVRKRQKDRESKGIGDDIPIGFGYDQLKSKLNASQGSWYTPDDLVEDGRHENAGGFKGLLSKPVKKNSQKNQEKFKTDEKIENITSVHTIPKDSILTDGVALTALIGRIPINGKTHDPYPVKIIVGKNNILANGHTLPEVEGMIFSGIAVGDWNLSCVSAKLFSASYIFEDGTVVNHSSQDVPLAYISDPYGTPCVRGKRVTDAVNYILKRSGLSALSAAGAAYADAQKQTINSTLTGNTTSTVIGDVDKLVAGDVIRSTTKDANQWLLERQQQSFDAIIVDPGEPIAVHLEKELALDYNENGRRLRYAKKTEIPFSIMD